MATRNIAKDIEVLHGLIPLLIAGNIEAIEFGNPAMPLGAMSHHRIKCIGTAGGMQICFKLVSRMMEGSGDYMGMPTPREIEIKAQSYLENYFRPTPFSKMLADMGKKLPSDDLTYFAVEKE